MRLETSLCPPRNLRRFKCCLDCWPKYRNSMRSPHPFDSSPVVRPFFSDLSLKGYNQRARYVCLKPLLLVHCICSSLVISYS